MSIGAPLYLGRAWRQGSLLLLLYLMSPSLVAQSNDDRFGGEGYGEAALLGGLEATNIGLAAIGTVLFIVAARRFAKSSDGIALGYHAGGIALLGMTRVFDILADRGVIYVHDDTLEFWWHMIFFMAMAMFVFGAKVLSDIDGEGSRLGTPQSLKGWCIVSVVVTIALFLTAEPLDNAFVEAFDGTIWDSFGVQHFIAFVVAALALLNLYASVGARESSSDVSVIALISVPLMITYAPFPLDHFWELLTESWEIFELHESIIEQTEQIIILPALGATVYAGWRLRISPSQVQQAVRPMVQ